jgi:hypothetical protein
MIFIYDITQSYLGGQKEAEHYDSPDQFSHILVVIKWYILHSFAIYAWFVTPNSQSSTMNLALILDMKDSASRLKNWGLSTTSAMLWWEKQ